MVRLFSKQDFPLLLDQYYCTFTGETWEESWNRETANQYLNELVEHKSFLGLTYELDRNLVGFCLGHTYTWFNGTIYHIDELFTSQQNKHQGIGTKLIEYLKTYCSKNNISAITLTTKRNSIAEMFYIKNGFVRNPFECNMLYEIKK